MVITDASARKMYKIIACVAFAFAAASSITACSTGGSLMNAFSQQPDQKMSGNSLQTGGVISPSKGSIAIAPLIGPPDDVSQSLTAQLQTALSRQSIRALPVEGGDASSSKQGLHTLRGYVVAARETTGTKVSYIWDITNASGERVHRITGENLIGDAASDNPWSSVNQQAVAKMANSTATSIAQWMSKNSSSAAARQPVNQNAAGSNPAKPKDIASTNTQDQVDGYSAVAIYVPNVKGAPGDGSTALSVALQNELRKNGLKLVEEAGASTHTVEGLVVVGAISDGTQPIKIDWVIKTPDGANVGTVSQKNKIPAGSLDDKWGATATAAASAAAQGIIRLLPRQTTMRS